MRLINLLSLVSIATAAVSNTFERRDAATVLSDINVITQKLAKFQSDINAFQPGPFVSIQAIAIQNDANDLDSAIKQAGNDAAASSNFNSNDSVNVANAVTNLQPAIYQSLTSLIAKKSVFQSAVLGASAVPLVENSLVTLRKDTATFAANVIAKLVPILQKSAPLVSANVDFHFERAVEAFSSG